ncbi:hypothetical protein BGZ88_002625 [Linnemannia elongata]|nr:hypothetical protein BGZ88_002625 [Linnemannia elongata]
MTFKNLREEAIRALDYSPNGHQLALGTETSIALWNMQSDEPTLELNVAASTEGPYDKSAIVAVAYSSCGQSLASANTAYIVHLWHRQSIEGDIESWSCVAALRAFFANVVTLSWNPVVTTEFITASWDGSVRVWRVSSDDGIVAVEMLWGTNLRRLCSAGVVLKGTTGLTPIHRKLLAQRRAFYKGLSSDDNGSDDRSEDDDGCEDGLEDGFEDGLEDGFEGRFEDGCEDDDEFDWLEDDDESDEGLDDGPDDESDDGSEVEK